MGAPGERSVLDWQRFNGLKFTAEARIEIKVEVEEVVGDWCLVIGMLE
ncbi:MAG: hypothetical protein MI922_20375 [Bacteroidales bacterium]|nr:hypothetical protein [Bacteroidales bacterium]